MDQLLSLILLDQCHAQFILYIYIYTPCEGFHSHGGTRPRAPVTIHLGVALFWDPPICTCTSWWVVDPIVSFGFQHFNHPRWCRISSIHSMYPKCLVYNILQWNTPGEWMIWGCKPPYVLDCTSIFGWLVPKVEPWKPWPAFARKLRDCQARLEDRAPAVTAGLMLGCPFSVSREAGFGGWNPSLGNPIVMGVPP